MLYDSKNIDFNELEFKCVDGTYGNVNNDNSPIFKKFYLYESIKSKRLPANKELKKFLGSSDITSDIAEIDMCYTIIYMFGIFLYAVLSLFFTDFFLKYLFFTFFTFFITVALFTLIFNSCTQKLKNKNITLIFKQKLFDRLSLKINIKELLTDYKKVLSNYKGSDENKEIALKIFEILNSAYYFRYIYDDYAIFKKHIKLLMDNDEVLSLVTGRFLLEKLEIYWLENSIDCIDDYFCLLTSKENKNKISTFNFNETKSLEYTWDNLEDACFMMTKGYKLFETSQLYEIIHLGFELDKFFCDDITDDRVRYFNKKIKWFIDTYTEGASSLLERLYSVDLYSSLEESKKN